MEALKSVSNHIVAYSLFWSLTTVTASLSRDSPNTKMCNSSLMWISSNTASTATGSTAEMMEANNRQGRSSIVWRLDGLFGWI